MSRPLAAGRDSTDRGYARCVDEPSGPGRIRASDVERERVARLLAAALTDGRLDLTEYDTRVTAVYAAVYREDLMPLVADLPTPDPPPAGVVVHGGRRPYGWPVVLSMFGGALLLIRLGWFRPSALLLALLGMAIVLRWISDDADRDGRPRR